MVNVQQISSEASLAHAITLVNYDQWKHWCQSNSSNILLVHGHMQLSYQQQIASPLTFVSWTLHKRLRENNDVLPLFHLCGQHRRRDDMYWGLEGVFRCLNAQLLFANPQSANTVSLDDTFIRNLKSSNINTLCQLLHILVPKQSKNAVFILIDGFTIAECCASQADISILAQVLRTLVNQLNSDRRNNLPGPVLKVLITTPTFSLHLGSLLYGCEDACVLDLPTTVFTPVGWYSIN